MLSYPNNQERVYKVTFANEILYVRGSDLSNAENEHGGILAIELTDIRVYARNPYNIAYIPGTVQGTGPSLENPFVEQWRKGPNWT